MSRIIKRVTVFCGAASGVNPLYKAQAQQLARCLVAQDIELVYGGARIGLMGAIADEVLRLGGRVIGVMPQSLVDVEIAHENVTQMLVVDSMEERKKQLNALGDAYITMPGGCGSMDELFEVVTQIQLGILNKPCGLLNVDGYYHKLMDFLTHVVEQGFMQARFLDLLLLDETPASLLTQLSQFEMPTLKRHCREDHATEIHPC